MEKVKEKNKHELNDSKGQYRGRLFDFEQKKKWRNEKKNKAQTSFRH